MIKFFRNIRRRLLRENRFTRYLLYAIGEIILVVIGILIALQINNWNEKRKNTLAFEKLITSFKKELRSNIAEANQNISRNYRLDSMVQLIVSKEIDSAVLKNNDFRRGFIGFPTTTIRFADENLNLLLNQKEDFNTEYEPLIDDLILLKDFIESQKIWENLVLDRVSANRRSNSDNLEWLNKNDSLSVNQGIDYILSNPIYRNRLLDYSHLQFQENAMDVNWVRLTSIRLLRQIENLEPAKLNTENPGEFIESLGLKPLESYNCRDSIAPLPYKRSFRMASAIYNYSKDSISLAVINEEDEKTDRSWIFPAKQISFLSGMPEGTILLLEKDGECIQKYQIRRNSILLFNER